MFCCIYIIIHHIIILLYIANMLILHYYITNPCRHRLPPSRASFLQYVCSLIRPSPPPPRRPRHPPPPPCPQTPDAQHKRRSATGEATIEGRATRVKSFDLRPGETLQSPLERVRQTCVVFAELGAGANPPRLLGERSFPRG